MVYEYAFMAWTDTTLHRVLLVIEMHFFANYWVVF